MFKYGEVLYRNGGWFTPRTIGRFCYRMSPVPGIRRTKGWFENWHKTGINCLPEKRVYHEHCEYVRGKRCPRNLPNVWDDYLRSDIRNRKSWKNKKVRKQYMKNCSKVA